MGRVGEVEKKPQSLLLFVSPHVSFALVTCNLTCSPLSKHLEQVDDINNMRFILSFFLKMEEDMSKEVSKICVHSFLKLGTQFFI